MRRLVSFVSTLVVLAVLSSGPVTADDAENCRSLRDGPELVIGACTRLIQSGALNVRDLVAALNDRGRAHSMQGKYDLAIADFDHALRLSPSFASHYRRWLAYKSKFDKLAWHRDYDRSIAYYTWVIPRDAAAHYYRGLAYASKGEYDHAIADFTWVIESGQRFDGAIIGRALAYAGKGEFDRAIADFTTAIERNPINAEAYYHRGFCWEKQGDNSRAIADYRQMLAIDKAVQDATAARRKKFYRPDRKVPPYAAGQYAQADHWQTLIIDQRAQDAAAALKRLGALQ